MSKGVAFACVFATCALQSACSEAPQPSNFHLATVAASAEYGLLFVAQPGFGSVDVLGIAPAGNRDQAPTFVARLVAPERRHVLRLAVDRDRARLWVADFKIVQVYELPSLQEVRRYQLPKDSYHDRFSDLVLDSSGNVLVLSRGGARISRIDAVSLDLEAWLDLDDRATDAALLLANRMLKSADERYLFLPSPSRGELLRVDLQSKRVNLIAGSAANLGCGLLFWERDSGSIRMLDCTARWEARIELTEDGAAASMAMRGAPPIAGTITNFNR